MLLTPGTRIGPYEVLAPIGAGGMGEVYRARDTALGREVAIKVLGLDVAAGAESLARFEREARLLATLNHPNIGAIYGLESLPPGAASNTRQPAIVLELIDGESLTDRIARLGTKSSAQRVKESLTIALQIADALDAAHERGIVHRDLKPANIKITGAGVVKVLDFGIAKAVSTDEPGDAAETDLGTRAGVVLGTAAYMSPEQARGQSVDKRTDIWAFGCVLYEMLSGRRAFRGETTADLMAKILERDPDLSALPAETPAIIRRLITHCLDKDVRRRTRDIADARAEIEEALSSASAPASPQANLTARRGGVPLGLVALGVLLIALVGAGGGWLAARPSTVDDGAPVFDRMVTLVSSPAHEFSPVISPDGKWVAYLSNARGPTDVWVKSIAGGDPANLTASTDIGVQANDFIGGLDISPDGTEIAFISTAAGAWKIPAPLGGVVQRVLKDGDTAMHWSPDGKRIVFVRTGGPLGDALVVSDPDGQNERVLIERKGAEHVHWPRWSADGRYVYFNHTTQNFNIEQTEIYRVPAQGGPVEPVVTTTRRAAYAFPAPDGRGVIYGANPDSVDLGLWWRDLKSGRDVRLTSGIGEYTHPSVSRDGRRMVGAVMNPRQALERVEVTFDRPATLEPITNGYSGDFDPVWTPDGSKLVFSTSRSGNRTLWSMNRRFEQPAPVTAGRVFDERPALSPDGKQIAFVSDRGGRRGIWIVSLDGGTPRLVGAADVVGTFSWSPDATRFVYGTPVGDAPGLMIMNIADGKATRLPTRAAATNPSWSRDNIIAYVEPRGGAAGAYLQLVTPEGGKVASSQLDGESAPHINNGFVIWSPDGTRLAVCVMGGATQGALWIAEPNKAAPYRKLLDLPAGVFLRGITWAPDGQSLIVGRYQWEGDIFLAEQSASKN